MKRAEAPKADAHGIANIRGREMSVMLAGDALVGMAKCFRDYGRGTLAMASV